jgi:hypothetical protein
MNIPIGSTTGFIGLGLLLLGGFMILAGFDIIRIEKVTVRQGRTTWAIGIIFAALGLVLLLPEITSAPEVSNLEIPTTTAATVTSDSSSNLAQPEFTPSPVVTNLEAPSESTPTTAVAVIADSDSLTEWVSINLSVADASLWRDTSEGHYSAVGSKDAFAWSTETYDGDLLVSFDLESPENQASGCVVVYGNGEGLSYGNLIFCVDWDGYGLEKHTIYHQGENYLAWYPSDVDLNARVYSVTIEIIDDTANMYVDEDKVLSSIFDMKEIDRSGRIGLLKKWFDPEVTFTNVRVRSSNGD